MACTYTTPHSTTLPGGKIGEGLDVWCSRALRLSCGIYIDGLAGREGGWWVCEGGSMMSLRFRFRVSWGSVGRQQRFELGV